MIQDTSYRRVGKHQGLLKVVGALALALALFSVVSVYYSSQDQAPEVVSAS